MKAIFGGLLLLDKLFKNGYTYPQIRILIDKDIADKVHL